MMEIYNEETLRIYGAQTEDEVKEYLSHEIQLKKVLSPIQLVEFANEEKYFEVKVLMADYSSGIRFMKEFL